MPRRRAELSGLPITSGAADVQTPTSTAYAGDIVHAVDPGRRRIYLALSHQTIDTSPGQTLGAGSPADAQRPLSRFVAIDEDAFDDPRNPNWVASFREPIKDPTQAKLHHYWVMGMTVTRHRVPEGRAGRLLVLFAQPQPGAGANPSPFYDHTLAQWDPETLRFTGLGNQATATEAVFGVGAAGEVQAQPAEPAGLSRQVEACSGASLAAGGSIRHGNYQWGLLATREAVWTACQANGGAAASVPLDADGNLAQVGGQGVYRLSQQISDVLVDEGGERLLIRTFGNGHTWWVFDTRLKRFTGAIAAKASDNEGLAAGVDPSTGRLYQLLPDYSAYLGSREVPFRGGFSYSDTRLNPAPPLENVRPDLAYQGAFSIKVDPPTKRVFLRRGHPTYGFMATYPDTGTTTPAPVEPFYRVLHDNVAITEAPPLPDDSTFTTDVAEDGLTKASFLGSGSGYGARAFLVGGLAKAANVPGPCGPDDRELVAGSVGAAEVSDLSTRAEAASLDGDAKTKDQFGTPVQRCGNEQIPASVHTEELAFDQVDPKTGKRDGLNRYLATCTEEQKAAATGPSSKALSRRDFKAEVACAHGHGRVDASATGGFSDPFATSLEGGGVQEVGIQVGYAHSEVTVTRKAGEGVTVTVDSIARDVTIPGIGTIALVRGETTVTSTGRRGGARASYHRTVCGVDWPEFNLQVSDCKTEQEQADLEHNMNEALRGQGRVRFRQPDPVLYAGSKSGYKAGVQRPTLDLFEDVKVARDVSPALPAMELVLYRGDSASGPGRQFFHFAGVHASTSYGIACLYGQRPDGKCGSLDDQFATDDDAGEDGELTAASGQPGETQTVTVTEQGETVQVPGQNVVKTKPLWRRIVEAPVNLVKDVLRLLFANPREFGLMAAVWGLLYAPCYLGERRRSLRNLRARRGAVGATA
ncbi:MAG: hypothetical protein M3394_00980 [Actinomycetota bacterium]|nr:hypothetical protein [Actinomycetota bacterium]